MKLEVIKVPAFSNRLSKNAEQLLYYLMRVAEEKPEIFNFQTSNN